MAVEHGGEIRAAGRTKVAPSADEVHAELLSLDRFVAPWTDGDRVVAAIRHEQHSLVRLQHLSRDEKSRPVGRRMSTGTRAR
jgi:hypothetical protein